MVSRLVTCPACAHAFVVKYNPKVPQRPWVTCPQCGDDVPIKVEREDSEK